MTDKNRPAFTYKLMHRGGDPVPDHVFNTLENRRRGDVSMVWSDPDTTEILVFNNDDEVVEWAQDLKGDAAALARGTIDVIKHQRGQSSASLHDDFEKAQLRVAKRCKEINGDPTKVQGAAAEPFLTALTQKIGDPSLLFEHPNLTGRMVPIAGGTPDLSWFQWIQPWKSTWTTAAPLSWCPGGSRCPT